MCSYWNAAEERTKSKIRELLLSEFDTMPDTREIKLNLTL